MKRFLIITLISLLGVKCGMTSEKKYMKRAYIDIRCYPENSQYFAKFGRWQSVYQCFDYGKNPITGSRSGGGGLGKEVKEGRCFVSTPDLENRFYGFDYSTESELSKECDIKASNGDVYRISSITNDSGSVSKINPDGTTTIVDNIKCTKEVIEDDSVDKVDCDGHSYSPLRKAETQSLGNPYLCYKKIGQTNNHRTVELHLFPDSMKETLISWCAVNNLEQGLISNKYANAPAEAACIQNSKAVNGAALIDWFYIEQENLEDAKGQCSELLGNIEL